MGKITAIRCDRQGKRVKIFLSDKRAFGLATNVLKTMGLQIGQELSEESIETLSGSDSQNLCHEAALRLLNYRPRSEYELTARLKKRGFPETLISNTIIRLKAQGLIDDAAFTRFWKENREAFRPRSQRLTRQELRQRGVDIEIIEEVVNKIDDAESAYRAALAKAPRLSRDDYAGFYRRLSGYLRRRGFDYSTTNKTVKKIWQELGGKATDSE